MKPVTIYTKGYCPYCHRALALLKQKNVNFKNIEISMSPDLRAEMIQRAGGSTTVPQIFVGDVHIGGSDDLDALERAGKLDALLAA